MARIRQVAFTVDKHGRPVAYRWCPYGRRWIRTGYDEAKLMVATGEAEQIPYYNPNSKARK